MSQYNCKYCYVTNPEYFNGNELRRCKICRIPENRKMKPPLTSRSYLKDPDDPNKELICVACGLSKLLEEEFDLRNCGLANERCRDCVEKKIRRPGSPTKKPEEKPTEVKCTPQFLILGPSKVVLDTPDISKGQVVQGKLTWEPSKSTTGAVIVVTDPNLLTRHAQLDVFADTLIATSPASHLLKGDLEMLATILMRKSLEIK